MFSIIKRIANKVRCFVLRVPDKKKLSCCFGSEYPKRAGGTKLFNGDDSQVQISMSELDQLLTQQEELAKDVKKVLGAIQHLPGYVEFEGRKQNKERPKFKCKCQKESEELGKEHRAYCKEKQERVRDIITKCKCDNDVEMGCRDRKYAEEQDATFDKAREKYPEVHAVSDEETLEEIVKYANLLSKKCCDTAEPETIKMDEHVHLTEKGVGYVTCATEKAVEHDGESNNYFSHQVNTATESGPSAERPSFKVGSVRSSPIELGSKTSADVYDDTRELAKKVRAMIEEPVKETNLERPSFKRDK
jgi:hypothetical protein